MIVVYAGLVNWIATTIVVESELARPFRDWVCRHRQGASAARNPDDRGIWRWADYLIRCHLCTGVWIGIAEAIYLGARGPAIIWTGLLIKAVGHLILELRPQAWPHA